MDVKGEIQFELVSKSPEEVIAQMPIDKGMLNPYGVVNAGAIIWFADVAASLLVLEGSLMEEGMKGFPLAININTNLMSNRKSGTFVATSLFVKRGKTVTVVRTQVTDEDDKLIAEVTSNHVLSR